MNLNEINIGLFADNDDRAGYLTLRIKDIRRKIIPFKVKDISNKYINFSVFDLLIFDLSTASGISFKKFPSFRTDRKLTHIPFLYIINEQQLEDPSPLEKDKPNGFLVEPFTDIEIESTVSNLSAISNLQRRQNFNRDILSSEKKLVYQVEKILQLDSLKNVTALDEFYFRFQKNVVHKIELTFAAEKALYTFFNPEEYTLEYKKFAESPQDVESQKILHIQNSHVRSALDKNSPVIIDEEMLLDPFVQELEEIISSDVRSLIFIPITVMHQTRGVLLIANKLYQRTFTENDLALSLIVLYKICYHLEAFYLKKLDINNLSAIITPSFLSDQDGYEQKFCRDILDSIGFGLIIFNHTFRLLFANSFAHTTLGIKKTKKVTLKDVLGNEAFDIINQLLQSRQFPLLRQEMLVNHPGSRQLYLGYSLYNITENMDNPTYALTFMEITQTKRLQAEIIRMDRMASLGVLASGIAHEIRNPLAGIKAMAQTLQEELETSDTKNEYIERIVRQVNRLDELLKSFFSYARPQRPNPVRSRIPDIVREVLPLFRRKIKESNIIVKEVYSRDLKEIFVDFHQIEQVFFNLIINAIDAMKDGGTLTIRARLPEETLPIIDRRQRIPKLFSDIYNEITISDTGVGMDSDTLNNMYNPFFTTKPNGTGLGLSIVYQIILEHGGQITVDSQIGRGTTFKILLPVYVVEDPELA